MVSPEMNPTICWRFEAEIILLFHAKTFHKGFQVTVHVGNVRQTATVEALQGKVRLLSIWMNDRCLDKRLTMSVHLLVWKSILLDV